MKENKIAFDCPFCHSDNYDFFKVIDSVLIRDDKKEDGFICCGCGIRLPESLIISFIDNYNYRFV
jgi:hypothetical protein